MKRNIEVIETSDDHIILGKSKEAKHHNKAEEEVSLKIMLFSKEELEEFQKIAARLYKEKSEKREKRSSKVFFSFRFNHSNK